MNSDFLPILRLDCKNNMDDINTANVGFEKEIWSAADKLRGNMDASEYKNIVLGLIFLKYISDKFEEKYNELKD